MSETLRSLGFLDTLAVEIPRKQAFARMYALAYFDQSLWRQCGLWMPSPDAVPTLTLAHDEEGVFWFRDLAIEEHEVSVLLSNEYRLNIRVLADILGNFTPLLNKVIEMRILQQAA